MKPYIQNIVGMASALSMAVGIPATLTVAGVVHAQANTCSADSTIRAELGNLPATASIEDAEGSIYFAISQTQCSDDELIAILEGMVNTPTFNNVQRQAIENVIERLRKRQLTRGTGAIGQSLDSSFTSPGVGGGSGGGSNYTAN